MQRVLIDNNQVGKQPRPNDTKLNLLTLRFEECLGRMQCSSPNDFEWREPSLLQQLHLFDITEAVLVIYECGVRTDRYAASSIFVIVDKIHPFPVESLPRNLVGRRPVVIIGTVIEPAWCIEVPQ